MRHTRSRADSIQVETALGCLSVQSGGPSEAADLSYPDQDAGLRRALMRWIPDLKIRSSLRSSPFGAARAAGAFHRRRRIALGRVVRNWPRSMVTNIRTVTASAVNHHTCAVPIPRHANVNA